MAKKSDPGTISEIERAKALYAEGDYKAARAVARTVLANPEAPEGVRREAEAIVGSTRLSRPSVIAGLVVLAIVLALFAWVLARPHVH